MRGLCPCCGCARSLSHSARVGAFACVRCHFDAAPVNRPLDYEAAVIAAQNADRTLAEAVRPIKRPALAISANTRGRNAATVLVGQGVPFVDVR